MQFLPCLPFVTASTLCMTIHIANFAKTAIISYFVKNNNRDFMKLGIIGLTGSGKTTLFNSLSKAKGSGDKNISAAKKLNIKITRIKNYCNIGYLLEYLF